MTPNHPDGYDVDTGCIWTITANTEITLEFLDIFDVGSF